MTSSRSLVVPAVALVAALAGCVAAAPAASAATSTRTAVAATPNISYGGRGTVTGYAHRYSNGAALSGCHVSLQRRTHGAKSWSTFARGTSNSKGAYSVQVAPGVNTDYRAVTTATSRCATSTSTVHTTYVHVTVTAAAGAQNVATGTLVAISGHARPTLPGDKVTAYSWSGSSWQQESTTSLDGASNYTAYVRPRSGGDNRFRIVVSAMNHRSSGAASTTITAYASDLLVNQPNDTQGCCGNTVDTTATVSGHDNPHSITMQKSGGWDSVVYTIGRSWNTLSTTLAHTDTTQTQSPSEIEIFGDSRSLWRGLVQYGQQQSINVDVTNVNKLQIMVTSKDDTTTAVVTPTLSTLAPPTPADPNAPVISFLGDQSQVNDSCCGVNTDRLDTVSGAFYGNSEMYEASSGEQYETRSLGSSFKTLTFTLGMADSTPYVGTNTVKLIGDGATLWTGTATTTPQKISVNVASVIQLKISVTGDTSGNTQYVDLADLRLLDR